jgi:hypothetical protein
MSYDRDKKSNDEVTQEKEIILEIVKKRRRKNIEKEVTPIDHLFWMCHIRSIRTII